MAHSRGSRFRPTARRSTSWSIGVAEVDGGFTTSAASLWSATAVPTVEGLTIIRTRGLVRSILASASAVGDGFFGAHGIGIVTDEAIAAGVSAVPSPLSDEDWEGWLWHAYFDVRAVTATIADGVNAAGYSMVQEIDSKAMRKLPSGMTLFGITEVTESGTAVLEVQAQTRTLLKNP